MLDIIRLRDRITGDVAYYLDEHVGGGQLLGPAYATRAEAEAIACEPPVATKSGALWDAFQRQRKIDAERRDRRLT